MPAVPCSAMDRFVTTGPDFFSLFQKLSSVYQAVGRSALQRSVLATISRAAPISSTLWLICSSFVRRVLLLETPCFAKKEARFEWESFFLSKRYRRNRRIRHQQKFLSLFAILPELALSTPESGLPTIGDKLSLMKFWRKRNSNLLVHLATWITGRIRFRLPSKLFNVLIIWRSWLCLSAHFIAAANFIKNRSPIVAPLQVGQAICRPCV